MIGREKVWSQFSNHITSDEACQLGVVACTVLVGIEAYLMAAKLKNHLAGPLLKTLKLLCNSECIHYFIENISEQIVKLTAIWTSISKNPSHNLYRMVCQTLAVLHSNQSDMWLAAFYLMETQAITFTHKASLISAKRQ